jgi:hypothetical protein
VYVDPDTRTVLGRVEWNKKEQPISKPYPKTVTVKGKGGAQEERRSWRKQYPWGTYRSMRRMFKLHGKTRDPEPQKTLEEVLPRALNEAFWEWSDLPPPHNRRPMTDDTR